MSMSTQIIHSIVDISIHLYMTPMLGKESMLDKEKWSFCQVA